MQAGCEWAPGHVGGKALGGMAYMPDAKSWPAIVSIRAGWKASRASCRSEYALITNEMKTLSTSSCVE